MSERLSSIEAVPSQVALRWKIAFQVSWSNLKRRLGRALVTMIGVILAIAFLTYILVSENIVQNLVGLNDMQLNLVLQEHGIDIYQAGKADRMTLLLIILALLTCFVGIVNAMLMSVTERVKEIGTLKCLGARDFFILQVYFIESSLQGVLGTLIGMSIGALVGVIVMAGSYGGDAFRSFPLLAVFGSLGTSLAIGTAISVTAAVVPAYWAARKQPVEAMRVEE
jgi:ABC-type lipoprotein release transport system permease subunit